MHTLQLIRVVTEKARASDVIAILVRGGAKGYTYHDAAGFGAHGLRSGSSLSDSNVLIEALVSDHDADIILHRLHDELVGRQAVVAYAIPARTLSRDTFL
jgi:nitrogen regulatory protein PII